MASNGRAGITPKERERFLHDHGFIQLRTGHGSHQVWEHPELKLLARSHDVTPPENIRGKGIAIQVWETTLCDDPGKGTWQTMVKHANWCQETVSNIHAESVYEAQRGKFLKEFRSAVEDVSQWKRAIKHRMKTGLEVDRESKPPVLYKDMQDMRKKKEDFAAPRR